MSDVIDMECLSDAAYVLGALTPAERQIYERHLAGCQQCQTSVRELAGMPALLANVPPEVLTGPAEPLPATLLPGLLRRARSTGRRRRWLLAGTSVLAAACAAALVVVLIVRPASPATAPPAAPTAAADQQVTLASSGPGAMTVTLALTDKKWGTAITVHCEYDDVATGGGAERLPAYQLVLVDKSNKSYPLGSWAAVEGGNSTVNTATALHRTDMAEFEVTLASGQVLLRGNA